MFEFIGALRLAGLMMRVRDRPQVGETRILCGNGGRLRFDDKPRRHQIGRRNAGDPLHDVGEFGGFAVDEGAAADMALERAITGDRFDRPPQRIARDAVFRGEVAFGRQPSARRPLAGGDAFAQRSFDSPATILGKARPNAQSLKWTGSGPIIIQPDAAANCQFCSRHIALAMPGKRPIITPNTTKLVQIGERMKVATVSVAGERRVGQITTDGMSIASVRFDPRRSSGRNSCLDPAQRRRACRRRFRQFRFRR